MQNKSSVKLSEESKEFLKRLRINRIKINANMDNEFLSYADLVDIIVKYFKLDKANYMELIKMQGSK
jgi:hypothetical protein